MENGKFWIENSFIDNGWLAKISGVACKVLLVITRHYGKYGTCYPSIRRLAIKVGHNRETVGKALRELQLAGYFDQFEIKSKGKLAYSFSKLAGFLDTLPPQLADKPSTKDRRTYKEENNFMNVVEKVEELEVVFSEQEQQVKKERTGSILDSLRAELESQGILRPILFNQMALQDS